MFPEILPTQADVISGDNPSTREGPTSISIHAARSFGRLISESKVPASASRDRLLVLDASSSTSPARGSMTGLIRCQRSPRAKLHSFKILQNCGAIPDPGAAVASPLGARCGPHLRI